MRSRIWAVVAALLVAVLGSVALWLVLRPDAEPEAIRVTRPSTTVVGLHVPWAVGGERIERDGSRVDFPGEWPNVPVRALRLWDTRTAWLNLEPAPGEWDFTRLDAFVAKAEANGVPHLTLVLGGTPRWAASRALPTDAFWLGPGSASPPRDLADWGEFVATVAERYRGRIAAYEIWNEPNDRMFWNGTPTEFAELTAVAAAEIRAADPGAVVVAPGFTVGSPTDIPTLTPWLRALAERRVRLDALSLHWYPRRADPIAALSAAVRALRGTAKAAGLDPAPIWLTEVNVIDGARMTPSRQTAVVRAVQEAARRARIDFLFWYAWTDLGPPTLMQFQPGSPAARGLGH